MASKTGFLKRAVLCAFVGAFVLLDGCNSQPAGSGNGGSEAGGTEPVPGTTNNPPLKLSVSVPKTEFTLAESVELTFTLENISPTAVSVCPVVTGNIHVDSFTVDGRDVQKRETNPTDLDLAVGDWLDASATIEPGGNVRFASTLYPAPGTKNGPEPQDAAILALTGENQGSIETHLSYYPTPGPGKYVLRYSYTYLGPQTDKPAIYQGTVHSNEVSFNVR